MSSYSLNPLALILSAPIPFVTDYVLLEQGALLVRPDERGFLAWIENRTNNRAGCRASEGGEVEGIASQDI